MSLLFIIFNKEYEEIFNSYKHNGSIRPLLRSFVFCFTGFFLRSNKILSKLLNKKYIIFSLIFPAIYLMNKYQIIKKYSIRLKVLVVEFVIICFFLFFSLIPFKYIKNNIINKIIRQLTNYTGGIYYIHTIVRDIHKKYSFFVIKKNYYYSLIIYIICFLICFFGNKITKNYKLKYLFN